MSVAYLWFWALSLSSFWQVSVGLRLGPCTGGKAVVQYADFGARGDGVTDDIEAIVAAHAYANAHGLAVKATDGATYYISGKDLTAIIETDTDFGAAAFIIDDRHVENNRSSVFMISSRLQPVTLEGIYVLKRGQVKIDVDLTGPCLITAIDSSKMRYIRFGLNQNNGTPQSDIFLVGRDGTIDMDAPIIWDFDQISSVRALPIDENTLTIRGGRFTTVANTAASSYNYYARGIAIRRSHVVVDGLEHRVTGEMEHGAPYRGFIDISDCAYVTVRNTLLTGHKTYQTIGAAGLPVSMGSYDISVNRALNVSFVNCSQTNDILDPTYWGIMGSNYCKNLIYDSCILSRFDAHMGVANATIRNSILGHQGLNAIGSGMLRLENSTVNGRSLINLRQDYGSTWEGEFVITNCTFVPSAGRQASASLIGGSYTGKHDFGYTCYMPEKITIENLVIVDSNHPDNYEGPAIFADFNPQMTDESYLEEYPYVRTRQVVVSNVTTTSGKALRLSNNEFMFRDVKVMHD